MADYALEVRTSQAMNPGTGPVRRHGASSVSVTLLEAERATSAAFTDDLSRAMDESQYDKGYGPCMEAAEAGATVLVSDIGQDERWPDHAADAVR